MGRMGKEVLALDIDEVIFPFVREFIPWHDQEFGTDLRFEDFHNYDFDSVLSISVPEVVDRVHAFLGQEHGHKDVTPIDEAVNAVRRLHRKYDIHALTARHPSFRRTTEEYLGEYFSYTISDLTLVGHVANMDVVRSKAEVCVELGAVALIDDSVGHVSGCTEQGIIGVLFGDYPWNSTVDIPKEVIRCKNWSEVLNYFGV
jgi:5'(3')-deoxyribonucleotidase